MKYVERAALTHTKQLKTDKKKNLPPTYYNNNEPWISSSLLSISKLTIFAKISCTSISGVLIVTCKGVEFYISIYLFSKFI